MSTTTAAKKVQTSTLLGLTISPSKCHAIADKQLNGSVSNKRDALLRDIESIVCAGVQDKVNELRTKCETLKNTTPLLRDINKEITAEEKKSEGERDATKLANLKSSAAAAKTRKEELDKCKKELDKLINSSMSESRKKYKNLVILNKCLTNPSYVKDLKPERRAQLEQSSLVMIDKMNQLKTEGKTDSQEYKDLSAIAKTKSDELLKDINNNYGKFVELDSIRGDKISDPKIVSICYATLVEYYVRNINNKCLNNLFSRPVPKDKKTVNLHVSELWNCLGFGEQTKQSELFVDKSGLFNNFDVVVKMRDNHNKYLKDLETEKEQYHQRKIVADKTGEKIDRFESKLESPKCVDANMQDSVDELRSSVSMLTKIMVDEFIKNSTDENVKSHNISVNKEYTNLLTSMMVQFINRFTSLIPVCIEFQGMKTVRLETLLLVLDIVTGMNGFDATVLKNTINEKINKYREHTTVKPASS